MFDISFGEFLLIGVVALVVLGPERLPAVARTLGALVARAQRFAASVKADIQQQTDLAGLSALKQEVQETAYAFKAQLTAELQETQALLSAAKTEAMTPPTQQPAPDLDSAADTTAALASDSSALLPDEQLEAVDDPQLEMFAELPRPQSQPSQPLSPPLPIDPPR